jgi:hypothetical protein
MMRKRLECLFNKLTTVGYYVLGVWILMALTGLIFHYKNELLRGGIIVSTLIYLESLFMILVILKCYDLKDAAKENRWKEFLPVYWGMTDMEFLMVYIALALASVSIFATI